jgi:hypothetical protein
MASHGDACWVRHWIIPECDCEYYIEAYVTHFFSQGANQDSLLGNG